MPVPKTRVMSDRHVLLLKLLIHGLCLFFLLRVYYLGFSDQLGGDPVKAIIHFTGIGALNLLLLTLAVTPLSRWSHQGRLVRVRRLLGLYCFTYAAAHLVNFLTFDLQFNWPLIAEELTERPYIVVGLCAFIILLLLAITSIPPLVRALGRRWKLLHSWIYIAVLLVCLHFTWSVKADITEPMIYLAITLVLLATRGRQLRRPFSWPG
ncbi:protein-methionine-sulfoxide reductase heme-binding subunit MsrQ [Pseudomaricurvus alcaniphilus]|uniref:protein-methionine-sulfoxide reductase heme-binding subunit MsrQ n=1 Tax=Pseudomaricurvus alcaniphilus TaxID=1166482 RepID=UPI001407BAC7|nr:protein-methionine-sulfoxide reductase heme-binding subunit MsrQ [Pseudomaricurvus alcaniphilus]NHN39629.1 protein-methionine-sulfoxide reductase heme-binding subunit MsrQ [Pseudomaricurvus alcaniphilus]